MPESNSQITSIIAPAQVVSATARALSSLVKMASPELTFDTYVTLRSKVGSGRLIASTSCGVLTAQIAIGKCESISPLPTAEIIGTAQFLSSLGTGTSDNQKVELSSEPGTGRVKYKRGSMKGDVNGIDPSSLIRTNISVRGQKFKLPSNLVRNALDATLFATVDQNAKETGIISRITTKGGKFECVTYDSLCGALFQGDAAELQDGIDFVLPNRMLYTLLSLTNDPVFELHIDPGVALEFSTKTVRISMTLREYPNIDVAHMIKQMAASADEGIVVDPKATISTVEGIISIGASDKEIVNVMITQGNASVRFMIKSESINCSEVIQCSTRFRKKLDIMVDSRRFLNFIKPCKKEDSIEIRHGSGRVIIQAPSALFAFSVS